MNAPPSPAPPDAAEHLQTHTGSEPVDKSGAVVRAMFSDIARTYDVLNHGLSLNLDRRWRRRAVTLLGPRSGQCILDGCCGTGDLSLEIARQAPGARVVGSDFALPMLRIADGKANAPQVLEARPIPFVAGDALHLPFASASFDAVAIAFGVRNFEDTRAGMREAARVLRPGGKLLVLEFMRPRSLAVQRFFGFFNALLAPVGRAVSGHESAYKYLPQSIGGFCTRAEFASLLRECGLRDVRSFDFSGGVSTAFIATKPSKSGGAS